MKLETAKKFQFFLFAGKFDTTVFNQLQDEQMEYLKELDGLDNSYILAQFRNSFLFLKKIILSFSLITKSCLFSTSFLLPLLFIEGKLRVTYTKL